MQWRISSSDAAGSRSKPRQWKLCQMINNIDRYWLSSISSDGPGAWTYRRDDAIEKSDRRISVALAIECARLCEQRGKHFLSTPVVKQLEGEISNASMSDKHTQEFSVDECNHQRLAHLTAH
jgi:hypothetical protein